MHVLKFNPLNPLNKFFAVVLFFLLISTSAWAEISRAVLWIETECPLENISTLTDGNGINYVVDTCGNIVVRDQYNVLWKDTLGQRVKAQPVLNNQDFLCVLTYFGSLHCFDSQGMLKWEVQLSLQEDERCIHAPLTGSGSSVFVVTNEGRLFGFENGIETWNLALRTTGMISAMLSSKYIIVSDESGKIYFVDKAGKTKKILYLGAEPVTRPSLSHDSVYFITRTSRNYYLDALSLDEEQLGDRVRNMIPYVPLTDVTPLVDLENRLWILTESGFVIYNHDTFDEFKTPGTPVSHSPVLMGDRICLFTDDFCMNAFMPPSDSVVTSALDVYSISSDISCDLSGNLYVSALSENGMGQIWRYGTSWSLNPIDPWPMAGKNSGYVSGEWYDYTLIFNPDNFTASFLLYESDELNDSNRFSDIEIVLKNTGKDGLPYSFELSGSAVDYSAFKDSMSNETMPSKVLHSTLDANEEKRFAIQCSSPFVDAGNFDLAVDCSFPGTYLTPVTRTYNIQVNVIPSVFDLDPFAGYASKCIFSNGILYCVSGQTLYRVNQATLSTTASVMLPFSADDISEYMDELIFYTERPFLTIKGNLLYLTMGQNFAIFNAESLELVRDFSNLSKDNLHMFVDSDQSVYLVREDDKNIVHIDDIYEEIEKIKDKELDDPEPARGVFVEPIMVEQGFERRLYVPGRDGKLTVWKDDKFLYKFQAGGALMAQPVLGGCGQILMPSWDGYLYVLGWSPASSEPEYLPKIVQLNFHQPLDHSPFIIEYNGVSYGYMVTGKGDLFKFKMGGYQQSEIAPIKSFDLPGSVSWWHSSVAYSDKTILIAFYPAIQDSSQVLPGIELLFKYSLDDESFQQLNEISLESGEIVLDIIDSGSNFLYFLTSYGKIIPSSFSETLSIDNPFDIAVFDQEDEKLSIILEPDMEPDMGYEFLNISVISRCFCKDETIDLNFQHKSFDVLLPSWGLNDILPLDFKDFPEFKGEWTLEAYGSISDVFMFDEVNFTTIE